jgi:hypothetical protein
MAEITTPEVKDYLNMIQGKEITLSDLRKEFNILPGSKSFDAIRNIMFQLAEQKIVRPTGRHNGAYKVVTQVQAIPISTVVRERRPPIDLVFPRDFETREEMNFAKDVIVREGDMILISGLSNYGKTTLAMSFCGENIDRHPVLMGNEYTSPDGEPTPRFLNRLDTMDADKGGWIYWYDETGDRFTLYPVRDDYAEHIVRDRINIIDWINIETGDHYMIGTILDGIKRQLGKGVAIVCIQKAEGAMAGRGGQFTKDFTDCELLIDKLGKDETLLTIGKVKESKNYITGKTYGYGIRQGVKIINFREVKKCSTCKTTGFYQGTWCPECEGKGYKDVVQEVVNG